MPFFHLQIRDHVAHVQLNRPEKMNAMNLAFWQEIPGAFAEIDRNLDVRVVLLSGAGRGFSAGLDILDMASQLPMDGDGTPDGQRQADLHALIRRMQAAITCVERCRVPVIAAIHGVCIGGAVDLITACDMRLASADARFSVRETRLAMVADVGTLQRLPALVGQGMARELVFTGRDFGADFAKEIGLVNRVLPDPQALDEAAQALALEIAANPPLTVQGAKRVLNEATKYEIDRGLEFVALWNTAHLVTQDLGVAVSAFATKQPAEFSGH